MAKKPLVLLTARQHARLGSRNSPALWRGISHREISIERSVEAKLAARWQSMLNLWRDSAMMAREVVAAGEHCLIACFLLWASSSKLVEAMEVLRAWAFSYRTCAVWNKEVIGPGYFFRQQHELLLLAARGSPLAPATSDRMASVIRSRRWAHSEKPRRVYEILERMYPTLPKLKLLARGRREGWSAWGNHVPA
jgi:N6-adenosine-specific RNA methylase IME4